MKHYKVLYNYCDIYLIELNRKKIFYKKNLDILYSTKTCIFTDSYQPLEQGFKYLTPGSLVFVG